MATGYTYSVTNGGGAAISTAITIIQVKAGNTPLEILRVTVGQYTSLTSGMNVVGIIRKNSAATVTAATPTRFNTNDPVALAVGGTAATGFTASAEGADGLTLQYETFNILNGYTWLPTPEERIWVPSSGIVAVKFLIAPTSATYYATVTFREWQ